MCVNTSIEKKALIARAAKLLTMLPLVLLCSAAACGQTGGPCNATSVHERLKTGEAVCFTGKERPAARTIPAAWLEELSIEPNRSVNVPIVIYNAIIAGPLDLSYATFEHNLFIVDSEFTGDAQFSFTLFKGAAIFKGTSFRKKADFTAAHSLTSLNIQLSTFLGPGIFDALTVDYQILANGAQFDEQAQFDTSEAGRGVDFSTYDAETTHQPRRTIFRGDATFRRVVIGREGIFSAAVFEKQADFDNAHFDGSLHFSPDKEGNPTVFDGRAIFRSVVVGSNAEFQGALFKEKATFDRIQVGHDLLFSANSPPGVNPAQFAGDANFPAIRVGGTLFSTAPHFYEKRTSRKHNSEAAQSLLPTTPRDTRFSPANRTSFTRTSNSWRTSEAPPSLVSQTLREPVQTKRSTSRTLSSIKMQTFQPSLSEAQPYLKVPSFTAP
jgi:hypothetical protein